MSKKMYIFALRFRFVGALFVGAFHFGNSSAAPAYALAPGRARVNFALVRTGGVCGGMSSLALKLNFLNWIRAIRLILLEGD